MAISRKKAGTKPELPATMQRPGRTFAAAGLAAWMMLGLMPLMYGRRAY